MKTDRAIDLLFSMKLDSGEPWGSIAAPFQVDDAAAIFDTAGPRRHFITRPRGGSKTTDVAGVALAWLAAEAPAGARGYVVAADTDQAALLIDAAAGLADRTPALRAAVTVLALKIVAKNGASVEVLAADGASAFGLRPHLIVCDEFGQWIESRNTRRLWTALFSSLQKVKGSRLVVLTSAGEPGHPAHKVLLKAKESKRWRVSETPGPLPWVPAEELDEQRAMLRESEYSRLMLNIWTQSEDRLVSPEDLDAACVLDGPQEPESGHHYVVSLDVGLKNDRTVAVVAHAEPVSDDPGAARRVIVDRLKVWQGSKRQPVELEKVERWIEAASREFYRAPIHCDPYQAAGLIQRLNARSLRASEFVFSQQSVGRIANALYLALRNRLLRLPDDDDLRAELSRVRLVEKSPGLVRLDHDSGQHDDQAVAIALAVAVLQGEVRQGAAWLRWMRQQVEELKERATVGRTPEAEAILRAMPHQNQDRARAVPARECQHRWQRWDDGGECCVHCHGWRQADVAA